MGAGNCFDIPLEELVDGFDETTLVDIDTEHTERALSELPRNLLSKVDLLQADVSGVVGKFSTTINRTLKEESTRAGFVRAATKAITELDAIHKEPGLGGKYAFVCSQLLMTQLSSIPFLQTSQAVGERYGIPLSLRPGNADEPLVLALNEQNFAVQRGHVRHLASLVQKTGVVHLADTVGQIGQDDAFLPMTGKEVFEDVDHHFTRLVKGTVWRWQADPARRFYVMADALVPKPE